MSFHYKILTFVRFNKNVKLVKKYRTPAVNTQVTVVNAFAVSSSFSKVDVIT